MFSPQGLIRNDGSYSLSQGQSCYRHTSTVGTVQKSSTSFSTVRIYLSRNLTQERSNFMEFFHRLVY